MAGVACPLAVGAGCEQVCWHCWKIPRWVCARAWALRATPLDPEECEEWTIASAKPVQGLSWKGGARAP